MFCGCHGRVGVRQVGVVVEREGGRDGAHPCRASSPGPALLGRRRGGGEICVPTAASTTPSCTERTPCKKPLQNYVR